MKKLTLLSTLILGLILNSFAGYYPGYTLFNPNGSETTYLIDSAGTTIHTWENSSGGGYSVYLLENGNIMRPSKATGTSLNGGASAGLIQEIDWDGNVIWEFEYNSSTYLLHHDIEVLPNGNILGIAWEVKSASEVSAAGFSSATEKYIDHIIEIEPTGSNGGNIVWEWHLWDHITSNNAANNPELFSVEMGSGSSGPMMDKDWVHANGIDYNAEKDLIIFSSHNFDEVYVIDHSTTTEEAASHSGGDYGKGGDILYRWGCPSNFGASGTQIFDVVHNGSWVPSDCPGAGNIMAFANGEKTNASSIVEVNPFDDNTNFEISYQPSASWTYSNGTNFYSNHLGSCQRLPNGNTFIVESTNNGYMFEVDSDGNILWDHNPRDEVSRALRYGIDYPGLWKITGTPISTIGNTGISNLKLSNYPNPFSQITELNFDNPDKNAELSIYSLDGKKLLTTKVKENNYKWDASNFNAGIYIARIVVGSKSYTKHLNLTK